MMQAWQVLSHEVPTWKRPYHIAKIYLAKYYLQLFFPKIEIIGIAGSVGKTTTKEAIAQVLKEKFRIKYSKANIDPVFNIPATILSLRPGDQKLLLELGIEFKGDMAFYLSLVRPKIAVMTRLTLEHPQFLGTLDEIIYHEAELLEALPTDGAAIVNGDDENTQKVKAKSQAPVYQYGVDNRNYYIWGDGYRENEITSTFVIHSGDESTSVTWQLIGQHTMYAALAAAAVGKQAGMSLEEIRTGLEKLVQPPSRMNTIQYNGATIINDAYNAMPEAMLAALDTLGRRKDKGRIIAVLATMKELGRYAEEMHRKVGKKVAEISPDYVVLYGENTNYIADEAKKNGLPEDKIITMTEVLPIIDWLKDHIQTGDTVLLKGSRHHIHLERVAFALQGKEPKVTCTTCPECS